MSYENRSTYWVDHDDIDLSAQFTKLSTETDGGQKNRNFGSLKMHPDGAGYKKMASQSSDFVNRNENTSTSLARSYNEEELEIGSRDMPMESSSSSDSDETIYRKPRFRNPERPVRDNGYDEVDGREVKQRHFNNEGYHNNTHQSEERNEKNYKGNHHRYRNDDDDKRRTFKNHGGDKYEERVRSDDDDDGDSGRRTFRKNDVSKRYEQNNWRYDSDDNNNDRNRKSDGHDRNSHRRNNANIDGSRAFKERGDRRYDQNKQRYAGAGDEHVNNPKFRERGNKKREQDNQHFGSDDDNKSDESPRFRERGRRVMQDNSRNVEFNNGSNSSMSHERNRRHDSNFNNRTKTQKLDQRESSADNKSDNEPRTRSKFSSRSNASKQSDDDAKNDGAEAKQPVTYIPPDLDESEETIFSRGVSQGINFDNYDSVDVKVTGENVPMPVQTFSEIDFISVLNSNVRKAGYKTPTPVQKYGIPIILKNRDLMACAQTGSGKTAAFILPIFDQLLRNDFKGVKQGKACAPIVLVILPTRELAIQTYQECRKFAFSTSIKIANLYGGVSVRYHIEKLRSGCDVLIGTIGRLLDIARRGFVTLIDCKYLVLDEADRMLDMGFERDIKELIKQGNINTQRNTLMFSATFPSEVQSLAQEFLKNDYLFLVVGIIGGACIDVVQSVVSVAPNEKRNRLKKILSEVGHAKTLIFVSQKRFADFLASDLNQAGFVTTSIHGDRMQKEREEALRSFISGESPYMVATNVAARGLDVPKVDHVVNFDLPQDITEYVHRIGRTGRCGNIGKATSFYDPSNDENRRLAPALVRVLTDAKQAVPEFLLSVNRYDGADTYDGFGIYSDVRKTARDNHSPPIQFSTKESDDENWD